MAFKLEHQEGRLYIAALQPPHFTGEVAEFRDHIVKSIAKQPHGGALFLNVTQAALLLPQVAAGYTDIMRQDNEKVLRVSIYSRNDMLGQQVMRMIEEAGGAKRRAFFNAKEAVDWMSPVLTPTEKKVLETYYRQLPTR